MRTAPIIIALGLAVQQAAAFWDRDHDNKFNCPSNSNNTCNPDQDHGYDWDKLPFGEFSIYGGLSWTGFTCPSLSKRTTRKTLNTGIQQKCITGHLPSKPSCRSDKDGFSVASFDISVDFDIDVDFEFDMDDGKKCKHTERCTKGGHRVENKQCGGAKGVTFKPHHDDDDKKDCTISVHSMSFSCGPPASTVPAPVHTTPIVTPTTTYVAPTTTPVSTTTPSPTTIVSLSTSTVFATTEITITACPPSVTSCPAEHSTHVTVVTSTLVDYTTVCPVTITQTPVSTAAPLPTTTSSSSSSSVYVAPTTQEVVTTAIVYQTTTVCPVTQTSSSSTYTTNVVSTVYSTYISTICTNCVAPTAASSTLVASSSAAASSSPKPIVPPTSCPDVLPKCLNTWIYQTGCKDNTMASCYCAQSNFTTNVIDCVTAYGANSTEIQNALSYLAGICAPVAPSIITAMPSTVTICPPATSMPVNTITYTAGTITSVVTVPAIQYTTVTAAPTVIATTVTSPAVVSSTVAPAATSSVVLPPSNATISTAPVSSPTIITGGAAALTVSGSVVMAVLLALAL